MIFQKMMTAVSAFFNAIANAMWERNPIAIMQLEYDKSVEQLKEGRKGLELYRGLVSLGAEVFTVPSAFMAVTGAAHWEVLLRARAIEDQCFVVAPAQWGAWGRAGEGRRTYGNSMVVDPWGRVLVRAPSEGDGVWFADLDMAELRRVRTTLPALGHRRLGLIC